MFCYICGDYIVKEPRKPITDFVKKAYFAYFGVRLGDQDKSWAPHIVCRPAERVAVWQKRSLSGSPGTQKGPGFRIVRFRMQNSSAQATACGRDDVFFFYFGPKFEHLQTL